MTDILIISGFLGAGKTTFMRNLIAMQDTSLKIGILENEFGEIGIDGALLQDYEIPIREITSGCICCSLSAAFEDELAAIIEEYTPDLILIEPSGVADLADVRRSCEKLIKNGTVGNIFALTLVDTSGHIAYQENFGHFYSSQIATADAILLTKTKGYCRDDVIENVAALNPNAPIFSDANNCLTMQEILSFMKPIVSCCTGNCAHEHGHHDCHHDTDRQPLFSSLNLCFSKRPYLSTLHELAREIVENKALNIYRVKGCVETVDCGWMLVDFAAEKLSFSHYSTSHRSALTLICRSDCEEKAKQYLLNMKGISLC